MALFNLFRQTAACCLGALLIAGPTQAQTLITSGDHCAPVNVGKANRTIQNIRGRITNTSTTESIAVSCPLVSIFPTQLLDVTVVMSNSTNQEQSGRCVLREKDITDADVQTIIQNADIPGNDGVVFVFEQVSLASNLNRLNLTCLLPPESGLGLVAATSLQ